MSPEAWIALGALVLAFIAYAIGATVFVLARASATEGKIVEAEARVREKIENCYNLAITKLEAVGEKESKARHDLANEMQRVTGQLAIEDKDLARRLNELAGEMVSKADLAAHEFRMSAILEKLDVKLESLDKKFDTKIEGLSAKIFAHA